jgi:hypothetical protein
MLCSGILFEGGITMPSLHLDYRVKTRKTGFLLMRRFIVQATFVILSIILLCISNANAATINAASCSKSHVQAAIDSASNGDAILVPAGNCTWTSTLSLDKNLTIQGAGRDSTLITRTGTAISIGTTTSRVTGIGFYVGGNTYSGMISAAGKGWRIDHCKFIGTTGGNNYAVLAQSSSYANLPAGLVDNNYFYLIRVVHNGINDFDTEQHKAWVYDAPLGTSDAVYIEDNVWEASGEIGQAVDANRGGKYVFRFNNLTNNYIEAHCVHSAAPYVYYAGSTGGYYKGSNWLYASSCTGTFNGVNDYQHEVRLWVE